MKNKTTQDQFYITEIHGRCKGGKTSNIYNRFGNSQYNTGVFDNKPTYVYFAVPSIVFPINRLEELYEREFSDFLIPSKKNFRKLTEYINPKHSHITVDVIRDTIEKCIRQQKLPVMRLKKEYLLTCQFDKDFAQHVRDNPLKYLEQV